MLLELYKWLNVVLIMTLDFEFLSFYNLLSFSVSTMHSD